MSMTLFFANIKKHWILVTFITAVLLLYTSISVGMFDPVSAESFSSMLDLMPKAMVKAFGFDGLGTELTGYLANYLYGFIYLTFPVIFIVIVANSLIAKHVDSGSMAYLLTTPNTRVKIATTQAVFLVVSSLVILAINVAVGLLMSATLFEGLLNVPKYLMLNVVTFGTLYVVAALCFFLSCLFNDAKTSATLGASIPVFFIAIKMVAAISEDLSFLKYLSLFSIIDTARILTDSTYNLVATIGTYGVGTVIFIAAIYMFNKRSLNI